MSIKKDPPICPVCAQGLHIFDGRWQCMNYDCDFLFFAEEGEAEGAEITKMSILNRGEYLEEILKGDDKE